MTDRPRRGASVAKRAQTAERRRKAIELRLAGVPWDAIATQLGYSSKGAACKDVTRALEASLNDVAHNVAILRQIEGERLDRLQRAVWTTALKGDLKAVDAALRIIAQRIHLYQLHQPDSGEQAVIEWMETLSQQMAAVLHWMLDAMNLPDTDRDRAEALLAEAMQRFAQSGPARPNPLEIEGEIV